MLSHETNQQQRGLILYIQKMEPTKQNNQIRTVGYRMHDTAYRSKDTGYRIYRIHDTRYRIQRVKNSTGYLQDTYKTQQYTGLVRLFVGNSTILASPTYAHIRFTAVLQYCTVHLSTGQQYGPGSPLVYQTCYTYHGRVK